MAVTNLMKGFTDNFEVYYDSVRQLGIATVDLGDFKPKTVTITGAGILGDFNMPSAPNMENLEITIHWRTITGDLTVLSQDKAHSLTLMSSQRNYDSGTGLLDYQGMEIFFRGLPANLKLGKLEQSSSNESDNTFTVDYLKLSVNGTELLEFDRFNYIWKVNGSDYTQKIRANLGYGF